MSINTKKSGDFGEKKSLDFLISNQFEILETNWRFSRFEIDIIAKKGDFIHFIEVKTRDLNGLVNPKDAVNRLKKKNIISAGTIFIERNNRNEESSFDIIEVLTQTKNKKQEVVKINFIENAFYPFEV